MYDNYSMPDPRFYKLYANKIRDMPSLRTNDIEGAKPKKMVFERNDFVNDYHARKQAAAPQNLAPQNLNYWPNPRKGAGALNPNVRHSADFNKAEDYQLPNGYNIPNQNSRANLNPRDYQAPYFNQAYQSSVQQQQQVNLRNPMYSDFDYKQYNNKPAPPQKYIEDSLDALQYQYGGYNPQQQQQQQYQYQQQQQQQPQQKEFKQDWLNFYGVETSGVGNQSNSQRQKQPQQYVAPPETLATKTQNDINLKANAAKFFGDGLSEGEQFQKNVNAFFADTMIEQPTRVRRQELNFKPELKLYNPLTKAPMLYYQKDPTKFEKPKDMSVKEQWQFKKNAERFFAA